MSLARITDSKLNSHVTLPGMQPPEKEAHTSMRIGRFNKIRKEYYEGKTIEGKHKPSFEDYETLGLRSSQNREKTGELKVL